MEVISLPIYSAEGKELDSVKLNSAVFDGVVNTAVVYQAVVAHTANQRRGLAATKTRGEVSGGGRKPWKQKGTGRARVGSIRSPLWRHGGVIFGPHPRDFSVRIPQKIKALALKSALNTKIKENNFIVLEDIKVEKPKTKELARILAHLDKVIFKKEDKKRGHKMLLLVHKVEKNFDIASRNIAFLDVNLASDTHAYEILAHRKVIITKEGLAQITNRLKK